ncbi:MAG TPA: ParB/RepB/Spo0J family partition protein [Jiangellaceae bacterium]
MTERRRGLGRGLGALIPTGPDEPPDRRATSVATVSRETTPANGDGTAGLASAQLAEDLVPVKGARFAELPVSSIQPNPRQPRQIFDEDEMAELVYSVREVGLLQPVVVRPLAAGAYELVMGERRWRAIQQAGLETIPAIVRDTQNDAMLRDALLENLHRSNLNPLEEAAAYQQLLDDFGCTHDELAARIGRSRPQISNTLRLLKLPPLVQRRVAAGVLSAGHARALLALPDAADQERLAQRIVAEGLSVRTVEEIVALGGTADEPKARSRNRAAKPVAPRLADIAADLSDRLDTRVKVDLGRSKGKVTIEFASIEDLERIVATIGGHPRE